LVLAKPGNERQAVELKIPLLFSQQSTFGKLSGMFGGYIHLENSAVACNRFSAFSPLIN